MDRSRDQRIRVDRGGWISGPMVNVPPLRTVIDPDTGTVDVVDGNGPLLSLTIPEARSLLDQLRTVLDAWTGES